MLTFWNDVPFLGFDRVLDDVMRSSFAAGGATAASQSPQAFQPAGFVYCNLTSVISRSELDRGAFQAERPFNAAQHVRLIRLADLRRVLAVFQVWIGVPDVLAVPE